MGLSLPFPMLVLPFAAFLFAQPGSAVTLMQRTLRQEYYWPEPRGRPESYGVSPFTAPRHVTASKLAWKWSNPHGKYGTAAHSGLLIDDQKAIYLSSTDGIRKFSSSGTLLWFTPCVSWRIPTLYEGKLYVTSNDGRLQTLSMETGKQVWVRNFTTVLGTDISGVAVIDGVLVGEAAGSAGGGASKVVGVNATTGSFLWEFKSDSQLWNMMPMSTGQGSLIFQDQIGGVYHLRSRDGQELWKAGYSGAWSADMTDGLAMLKDGVVYAVHSDGPCCKANGAATLRAYDLATGEMRWGKSFHHPVNTQPVVGYLGKGAGLSDRLAVVAAVGAQPAGQIDFYNSSIVALDAKTGEQIWEYRPPTYFGVFVAGDVQRLTHGTLCLPNPYGSPSIDARGTVYTGHFNGNIYAIRDDNGDGVIQEREASKYDTGAGFSHGGAALAPGMLAIPSCDGLYVFQE